MGKKEQFRKLVSLLLFKSNKIFQIFLKFSDKVIEIITKLENFFKIFLL